MKVNLHHLELFYYTAKARGITEATRIVPYGIGQSALSQQLKILEEDCGVKLFERRPFSLTAEGRKLYCFAAKFFDSLDGVVDSLKSGGEVIRFSCPGVIGGYYFPGMIRMLMEKYPRLRPNVTEADGTLGIAKLLANETDVAVTFAPPKSSKALETKVIARFPMALVVSETHRFVRKKPVHGDDFAGERWIALQEASGGTEELCAGLSAFGIRPEFIVATNSIDAAIRYAGMGLGIALMAFPPPDLTRENGVCAIPCPELFGTLELGISWTADTKIDRALLNDASKCARRIASEVTEDAGTR